MTVPASPHRTTPPVAAVGRLAALWVVVAGVAALTGPLWTQPAGIGLAQLTAAPDVLAIRAVHLTALLVGGVVAAVASVELAAVALTGRARRAAVVLVSAVPAVWRSTARARLGLGSGFGSLTLAAAPIQVPEAAPSPEASVVDASPDHDARSRQAPTPGTAVMTPSPIVDPTPDVTPAGIETSVADGIDVPVAADAVPVAADAAPPVTSWVVAEGESFWTIADEVTSQRLGRAATDREIDPVWRTIVRTNRARLLDPSDPDLLWPGQVLDIPPPA